MIKIVILITMHFKSRKNLKQGLEFQPCKICKNKANEENDPNDSPVGGCFIIEFQQSVELLNMGLLDMEDTGTISVRIGYRQITCHA